MKVTEEVQYVFSVAKMIAREYQNETYSPSHMIRAVLNDEKSVIPCLELLDKDVSYLKEWADVRIETYPKGSGKESDPVGDVRVGAVMEEAEAIMHSVGLDIIDPLCVLAAICRPNVAFTKEQLKSLTLTADDIIGTFILNRNPVIISENSFNRKSDTSNNQSLKAIKAYCIDKTLLARDLKIDPIVGRDRETRMMIEILGRRSKPNVLITGEPGVGKTALVDGFALSIISNDVPAELESCQLFELDLGSLVAGSGYKGEIEDRLKKVLKETKSLPRAIIFIDEIHSLLDSNGPFGSGVANILKPELARGEITIIGATTTDEYRKFIEPEQAFNRRFEVLNVEEPDIITAAKMLETLLPLYVNHHKVSAAADLPIEAVNLAKRYLKERRLPDSAIDLLDGTMSAIKMANNSTVKNLHKVQTKFDELLLHDAHQDEFKWLQQELNNTISPILLGQLVTFQTENIPDNKEFLVRYMKDTLKQLAFFSKSKKEYAEKVDLASMVAYKTGIPLGKIQAEERGRLLNMEVELGKKVIGQKQAIISVSDAIRQSRANLSRPGQPIGSFFFLGSTGTGKTELAKSLADFLFNDENALIRFDMSEFKEEHSAALLYGAPPGYIGYKEGGLLVNKIREKPYSVVLFDEIEKAHSSVFDVFLQILDEGKLNDRLGKTGDFSNAVILFTSNIGSERIVANYNAGNPPATTELLEIMTPYFRPEFLARITEIVPFAPITENSVLDIFKIHFNKFCAILKRQGIVLTLSDQAERYLALSGFTQKYGARQLNTVIRDRLSRPLSKMIISNEIANGSHVEVSLSDEKLEWKILQTT